MSQAERQIGVKAESNVASARDVVNVACKMPNGLIIRELAESVEHEPVMGGEGTRAVKYFRPTGDHVVIEGTAARFGAQQPILINGGFRVTRDVPKSIWDSWYAANKTSDLVRNGLIYASEKYEDTKAFSREHERAHTGLEGVDPSNPGKHARGITRADKNQ